MKVIEDKLIYSFITSSASSLIMTFMLSLSECIILLMSIIFRRNKSNCYCWLNFPSVRFFEIIYDIFYVWPNFVKVFFWVIVFFYNLYFYIQYNCYSRTYWLIYWFIYSITSYCFIITSSFMLKIIPNLFNCFIFFFWSKKFLIPLIAHHLFLFLVFSI